jgi:hypothetical protein
VHALHADRGSLVFVRGFEILNDEVPVQPDEEQTETNHHQRAHVPHTASLSAGMSREIVKKQLPMNQTRELTGAKSRAFPGRTSLKCE